MQRLKVIGLLCLLVMLFGCATVNVVDESGRPVPDHVVRGSIPATGMRVDFALIRYYGQKEGDEFLDTHEYLNPYDDKHVFESENLRSVAMLVQIANPAKSAYRFVFYYDFPMEESPQEEILYEGDLSRKEFHIKLNLREGAVNNASFELQTVNGLVFFRSPLVRYEVKEARPVVKDIHSESTEKASVTGTGAIVSNPHPSVWDR